MTGASPNTTFPTGTVPTAGLDTLAQIRGFLAAEVVPAVPAELAGEVRAVVKLLRTVETELECRHVLLRAEIDELLALCATALADVPAAVPDGELAVLRRRADLDGAPLSQLDRLHRDVGALTGQILTALQSVPDRPAARTALDRLCAALGRHAEARLRWQAVFPVADPAASTEGTTA
ncbi:hypothetical protein [Streptomyces sp. cg40]|uniref:hypothetical protein n=1 Tax=Streptomyces sp. cg40 TaxID=3419764 RepID=UPI003D034A9C